MQYLKHTEINKATWDKTIFNSGNGRINAFSWYLDIVSPNWDAVVNDEYQVVMPVTWKRKYGFKYVIQPLFSQQSGVFFKSESDVTKISEFLNFVIKKCPFISINLNTFNHIVESKNFNKKKRQGQELLLNRNYNDIRQNYSPSNQKNIRRAGKFELKFDDNIDLNEFITSKFQNIAVQVIPEQLELLKRLIAELKKQDCVEISGIRNSQNNLITTGCFLKFKNRIYFLTSATTLEGKEKKAMFALVDGLIQKYAGSDYVLDFVGSNIDGIAYFNKGFGATDYQYYQINGGYLYKFKSLLRK